MNLSGSYRYDEKTKTVIKISDKMPSLRKITDTMRTMDGDADVREYYKTLESKGKLTNKMLPEMRDILR